MDEMTHERCSELLPAYVRQELPESQAQAVAAHLAGCPECASERRAIVALQQPEPIALTEMERARMRRVVLEEAVPGPEATAAPPTAPAKGRLLPLLGAAAVLVVAVVFAFQGLGGLGGSDEGPVTAEMEEQGGGDAAGSGRARDQSSTTEANADALDAAGAPASKAAPLPTFKASVGDVDTRRLNRLGRQGLPLVIFSRSYTVDDVPRLRDEFTDRMADAAPDARADQLRECVATIASNFPNALPAYSAIGDFVERPRREVLIAAFAWTDATEGPLDQSMVWAWPLGTCDSVAHYSKNLIEPRR